MMHRDDTRIPCKQRRALVATFAIAVTLLGAQATSWAAAGERAAAPAGQVDGAGAGPSPAEKAPLQPSMAERYAAREATSKNLETFKGGDVVIIGSSALVIVLIVVLVLVII
jgi:hypothetical protein